MVGKACQSLIQHVTINEFLARVISVYFALIIGAQAIALLIIGWIAEFCGFRMAFGSGAVIVLITGPGPWRRAKKLKEPGAEFSPSPLTGSTNPDVNTSRTAN